MKIPLLDLKAQYNTIKSEIRLAVDEVLESQHFILGPKVTELEGAVAAYSDCQYAVGVSSGSDALLICLMVEGIGHGDEVITTPYTFFATAGAISRTGARPVFVDIDPDTYNMSPDILEEKITPKTRAIIPVHLYGQCADMESIMEMAGKYGLVVIEDAAQAIGAECFIGKEPTEVRRAGSMGDYGCFSFFPSKNLGGLGDGGMVVTNDKDRAEKLRVFRAHGSKPKYYHKYIGGNFRLDALQAAVLSVKLRYLDAWTEKRQENAARYESMFLETKLVEKGIIRLPAAIWKEAMSQADCEVKTDIPNSGRHYHIYNQYVINTMERDKLKSYLAENDIGTEIYYPVPLHLQDCFSDLGYGVGSCPVSEESAERTLALPVYPELTADQQQYVVERIEEGLSR